MRKKIFIHIGTHKTGTTSIQFFLTEELARLHKEGIFVPHAGTGLTDAPAGHHNVAYELCGHPSYDATRSGMAELIAELQAANHPTAVISSENLQFLHTRPDHLRHFDAALAAIGYDRTYMVFFRNPDDYFLSLYSQLRITGRLPVGDYTALRARMKADGYIVDRIGRRFEFDYERFAHNWRNVIGPNLLTFDYDEVVSSPGVLPCFLQVVGASSGLITESRGFPRLNVTQIGRNDLCPCQSGKRYKHCHGALA